MSMDNLVIVYGEHFESLTINITPIYLMGQITNKEKMRQRLLELQPRTQC
jgi:hypothetical protein